MSRRMARSSAERRAMTRNEESPPVDESLVPPAKGFGAQFWSALREGTMGHLQGAALVLVVAAAMIAGKLIWPNWQYFYVGGLALLCVPILAALIFFAIVNK